MAREYRHVDPSGGPSTSMSSITDWAACVICQEQTSEALTYPAAGRRGGQGYVSLAESIEEFIECGFAVLVSVDVHELINGSGLKETLIKHKASWRRSCRDKLSKRSLDRFKAKQRADKQKADDLQFSCCPARTRRTDPQVESKDSCFFCDKSSGQLHMAATFGLDYKVRCAATFLKDQTLLKKNWQLEI